MSNFAEQLKEYFNTATPEQLEQDYQELASYGENSPTIDEYLSSL